MKKFVIGDIHSSYKGLIQVFEKSNFSFKEDKAIFLGDINDGWSQSKECMDFIMSIPNKEVIMGNHDEWLLYYNLGKAHYENPSDLEFSTWKTHGGNETIKSLGDKIETKYLDFIKSFKYFHEEDNNLFVHAGYSLDTDDNDNLFELSKQHPYYLCWDRSFINHVFNKRKDNDYKLIGSWKEIFIGHTPTIKINEFYKTPKNWLNVWNMDTGSAFEGKISMMNIDSKEFFQSDESRKLYPDERGRNDKSWNEIKRY